MSCITNFQATPQYCGDNPPQNTNCPVWNSAMTALQTKKKTDQSGNLNANLTTCYTIDTSKIKSYAEKPFQIQDLADQWSNDMAQEINGLECQRSNYGTFMANGQQISQMNGQNYWLNQIRKPCLADTSDLNQCYPEKGVTVNKKANQPLPYSCVNSENQTQPCSSPTCSQKMTCQSGYRLVNDRCLGDTNTMAQDFQDSFSYATSTSGTSGAVSFNFNCLPKDQRFYTQCRHPGWDFMSYDSKQGWIINSKTKSGQNPLKDQPHEHSKNPNFPWSNWFSANDAKSNQKVGSETWNQIYQNDCDTSKGQCCIANSVTSDTIDDQVTKTCTTRMSEKLAWDSAKVYFLTPDQKDITTQLHLPYCGVGTGVAITPSKSATGGVTNQTKFWDVRQCISGTFEGTCQGLTGCTGLDGGGVGVNDCMKGLNNFDGDVMHDNPAENCPNVYNLSRQIAGNCSTDTNFDDPTNSYYLKNMTGMILPEGAQVNGWWSPSTSGDGDWGLGSGICAMPDPIIGDQKKNMVQLGCGRETRTTPYTGKIDACNQPGYSIKARAAAYEVNPDGTMNLLPGDGSKAKDFYNDSRFSGKTQASSDNSRCLCSFSGLDKVVVDTPQGNDQLHEGYHAYTFGFMPGAYDKRTCQTGPSSCSNS